MRYEDGRCWKQGKWLNDQKNTNQINQKNTNVIKNGGEKNCVGTPAGLSVQLLISARSSSQDREFKTTRLREQTFRVESKGDILKYK